jgi:hypothetical protein
MLEPAGSNESMSGEIMEKIRQLELLLRNSLDQKEALQHTNDELRKKLETMEEWKKNKEAIIQVTIRSLSFPFFFSSSETFFFSAQ